MRTDLTILMPVLNGMPFLPETLASIEHQTLRDFELIVWDNGSTDGTLDELHRWIPNRIPGRVITDRPMRLGACRTAMIRMARTDLCAYCDADDIYLPQRLASQMSFMSHHPEIGLVGTNVHVIDENSQPRSRVIDMPCSDTEIRWRLPFANAVMQPTVMFRRNALLAAGAYRNLTVAEDYDLWLRMLPDVRMANLPDRLVRYRLRRGSTSRDGQESGTARSRALLGQYLDRLMPGVERSAILRVHERLTSDFDGPVSLLDVRTLHRAAGALAKTVGEASGYFRHTERYREQQQNLRARWLKQLPLARYALAGVQKAQRRSSDRHPSRRAA